MTLINQESSVTYNGNGVTTQWPFTFIIPSNSQKVGLFDIATNVLTELDPSDYSITGLDDPNGGTVDYPLSGTPITSAKRLVIWRDLGYTQDTDLTNQTPFYPEVLENQLDRIVMQIQQLAADSERAIKVTLGSNLTPDQFVADLQEGAADAQQSASNALASELKAQKWAENPEDSPVEPGQYSAYHWAAKASAVSSITGEIVTVAGMQSEIVSVANALPILIDTATVLNAVVRHDVAQALGASAQGQARENIGAASRVESGRSLTVNGSLLVSQENGDTLGTANGYFYADQKALYRSPDLAGKISAQRVAYSSLAGGSKAAEFKCVSTATLAATSLATDTDFVEGSDPKFVAAGWGAAGAKSFVYRKEVQKPAGTYSFHFANRADDRHMWVQYTIGAGEANTPVVVEVQVPPDIAGTWSHNDGEIGLVIDDVLVLGSNYVGGTEGVWGSANYQGGAGQKNFLDSTANVARHTDFGLKLDPDATGVYGQYEVGEVDAVYRSERYVYGASGAGAYPGSGLVYATNRLIWTLPHRFQMAKVPAILSITGISTTASDGSAVAAASFGLGGVSRNASNILVTSTQSGWGVGNSSGVVGDSAASKALLSARLS